MFLLLVGSRITFEMKDPFEECSNVVDFPKNLELFKIDAGKSKCVKGTFVIGSNSSYSIKSAFPSTNDWIYSKSIQNPFTVLHKSSETVSLITCTNVDINCYFQFIEAKPSFNMAKKKNNTKVNIVQTSIVSTKKKNNLEIINKKFTSKGKIFVAKTFASIAQKTPLEFNYKKSKEDRINSTLTQDFEFSRILSSEEGSLGTSNYATFYPLYSKNESFIHSRVEITTNSAKVIENEFFFDEFSYEMPEKQGVMTRKELFSTDINYFNLIVISISVLGALLIILYTAFYCYNNRLRPSNQIQSKELATQISDAPLIH